MQISRTVRQIPYNQHSATQTKPFEYFVCRSALNLIFGETLVGITGQNIPIRDMYMQWP